MVPNFLVVGAMKAGTTSFYAYLKDHPQVFMASPKELHFFVDQQVDGSFGVRPANWSKGIGWYERHFEAADGAIARGEASPTYSAWPVYPGVAARMASVVPEARLIYVIRHPIERLHSQFVSDAMRGAPGRIDEVLLEQPGYLARSRYADQIEQYLEHFPREQLLVIRSEDLRDHRRETMRRVYGFLGVDTDWVHPDLALEHHRTAEKRMLRPTARKLRRFAPYRSFLEKAPSRLIRLHDRVARYTVADIDPDRVAMSDDLRRELESRLRDDVRRLRTHLGPDFDGWGIA